VTGGPETGSRALGDHGGVDVRARLGDEPPGEPRTLTGWGRTAPSRCFVRAVSSREDVIEALQGAPRRGALARGLGRSYGDLAQNGGGLVLDMTGLDAVSRFDRATGTAVVEAGCSLSHLLEVSVPAGWFIPVTPGTRHVTVGGAIACDVHGKNHHRDGSFGRYVRSLTLLAPTGELHRLDPASAPEEFGATVGGLGLTGVVLEAELSLLPIETATMRVDVERAVDLDDTFARLESRDHLYRYSVSWVDCRGRGRRFGRSVVMRGDHASRDDLDGAGGGEPLGRPRARAVPLPAWCSVSPLLRGPAGDAFNELYFRRAHDREGLLQPLDPFFYPLDAVSGWNRLYGRAGFLQYQFVVPFGREQTIVRIAELLSRCAPTLVVLKRFGEEGGPLSFPVPGWTLAVDLPLPSAGLGPLLDRADGLVADAGGRVYLAKDARLRPERLEEMYPRLAEWREVQARLDPEGRMQGDLARRLGLVRRGGA
jgi:decaprenylphospho-beta-D-ribofuranose 2-oxidase